MSGATTYTDTSRTDAGRWQRLAEDLTAAGYPATVTVRRRADGTSRSITVRLPWHLVEVRDTWFHDMWAGWQVWLEGRDSIAYHHQRGLKKRSAVVAAVVAAAEGAQA